MMHKRKWVRIGGAVLLLLLLQVSDLLAATVSVVSSGSGKYLVQGAGFTGVAALDVTVKYDTATLGSPQVSQKELASGTIFVANPNIPGQVRLAFVRDPGVSGSGVIAEISFTVKGSSAVQPTISAASLYDANGTIIPITGGATTVPESAGGPSVQPVQKEPLWTGGSGGGSASPQSDKSSTTTSGGQVWLGTVSMPGDTSPSREPAKEPAKPLGTDTTPTPSLPAATGSEQEAKSAATPPPAKDRERFTLPTPPASVLERFRTYNGERTVVALKPLFAQRGGAWVVQEPAIAPADGATKLTVQVTLERVGLEAPNFALRGLEMTSLRPVDEAGWRIEAVPAKGGAQASISMLVEDASAEIPLTIVPPLPKAWDGKKLTEAEVNRFLAERGTDKAPLGDLNGDGRRDYRDDYIMIGNYLLTAVPVTAKTEERAKVAPADNKPPASPASEQKGGVSQKGRPKP